MRLVLASASPRRAELLASAGFSFEIRAVDVDERVLQGESPGDYVCRLASEKSARALERLDAPPDDVVVLGADTTVVVDGEILGKPEDEGQARDMLRRLSGRAHQVITGVSLRTTRLELGGMETTTVWFAELTPGEIAWYAASGEGRDKAGAYAIQGVASRFIPRIEGSSSNVVGLPIALVHAMMERLSPSSTGRNPAGARGT